jgi:hypothetical protein
MPTEISGPSARLPIQRHDHQQAVAQPFSIEEAQKSTSSVGSAPTVKEKEAITKTDTTVDKATTKQALPAEPSKRPISKNDIVDHLMLIKQQPTEENQRILSTIIQHGLDASEENFNAVLRLLKGRKEPSALESSVLSLAKGLSSSNRSVDIISTFFSQHPQLANLLKNLQKQFAQLSQVLQFNKELLATDLFNGLTSILTEFDQNLKKLFKKEDGISNIKRGVLLKDLKVFHEFLSGIAHQISESNNPQAQALLAQILRTKQALSDVINSITSHAILSKNSEKQIAPEKFAYWQLPNPLANPPKDLEIIIKKDHPTKNKINPDNTKIIVKLDTPDIGELVVTLNVKEKNLSCNFETNNSQTKEDILKHNHDFKAQIEAHNYRLTAFRTSNKTTNTKKLIFPTYNLDNFSRIRTEA